MTFTGLRMKGILKFTCLSLLVCLSAAQLDDPLTSKRGPDLSSCTRTATPDTKQHMKAYRQCVLQTFRNEGMFNGTYSDEVFNDMLSNVTSDAMIDDICFDEEQAKRKLDNCMGNAAHHRAKRGIFSFANKWPIDSPIPYAFGCTTFTGAHIALIRSVFAYYADNTCLSFEELDSSAPNDGIIFTCDTGESGGCFSYFGNSTQFVPQQLNLEILSESGGTCLIFAVIAHELLHAFGVVHEQARADRDEHVIIFFENIRDIQRFGNNFDRDPNTILYTRYDYTSVMHYGKNAFANPGTFTLVGIDPDRDSSLGQIGEVSFLDLLGLNLHYCDDCPNDPCLNQGYLNPSNCSGCICTPVFDTPDTNCSDIPVMIDSACLGDVQTRTLTTNGDTTEVQLGDHIVDIFSCAWRIEGLAGHRMRVDVLDFDFFLTISTQDELCVYEWLEIYIEDDAKVDFVPSQRWCGVSGPDGETYNTTSLIILFRSTQFPPSFGTLDSSTFTLIITLEEIPTTTTTSTTTITTPTTTITTPTTTITTPTTTITTPTTTITTPTTTITTPTTTITTPTTTVTTPTTTITTPTTTITTPTTTMPTEVLFEVRLLVFFFFGNPPPPQYFTAFFQFLVNLITFILNSFCPNNCPVGFTCAGVFVQAYSQELFRNNFIAIYVVRIQVTILCQASTNAIPASNGAAVGFAAAATDTNITVPVDVIRNLLLASFNNLISRVDSCCAVGIIPACCDVNVWNNITTGPVNGTVQIPIDFTTTTTTSTPPIRPVVPAPTRRSLIAEIWGGVGAAVLFVIILIVFMLFATGGCKRFRRQASPSLTSSPFNNAVILRQSNKPFQPGLHHVADAMSPYYS